jgi:NTP pyrophosphatase (non-canonical NTP hydrolase)
MNFSEYQEQAKKTAKYPEVGNNYVYPTLGLAGESGEVAEKIKKVIRDQAGVISDEARADIQKELGDVLWYVAQLATELGLSLEDVALGNVQKLQDRMERNALGGSGDHR